MLATIFCTAALALLPAWEMRQDTRSLQELRSALEDTDPKGRAVAACTLRGMGGRRV